MPPDRANRSADAPRASLPGRQVVGMLVLALVLAAGSLASLWILYQQSYSALDRETGRRLQMVASTAAATVPGDSLLVWVLAEEPRADLLTLRRTLRRMGADNDLSRVLVFYRDRTVVLDTEELVPRGEPYAFLRSELGAVSQALARIPSYAEVQEVGEVYLKAGYAPVFDDFGDVEGFVGVQASPLTFDALKGLRTTLYVLGGSSLALIALLTGLYLVFARRLGRARAALQRAETLSTMGRMAAGIAHEIRNPLGIIKNTAQLLREELQEKEVATDLVDFIPEEIDRLNQTLTGYLEFAKDAPLRPERVELSRLVHRTLELLRPDFENAGVRALDNCDEVGQLHADVDPRRLQQVLLNLLLNSVQALPEGGEVRVELGRQEGAITIRVGDDGPGMDEQLAAQVFEPFVTTKDKGSGLGLSVVRRIVEDHGGSISLRTAPGEGTEFLVLLPESAWGTAAERRL